MSEKFFYREIPQNTKTSVRIDLGNDFTKALLGDVSPSLLPQSRNIK